MSAAPDGPIAIYYEHPDWFKPLFAELDRREIPYVRLDATSHSYDPSETESPYSLVFNRASPSAYLRGHEQVTFHTLSWLRHLERISVPLVNGPASYQMEISKALQLNMLEQLGLPYPRARVINNAARAPEAARGSAVPGRGQGEHWRERSGHHPVRQRGIAGCRRQRWPARSRSGSRRAGAGAGAAPGRAHHARRGSGRKILIRDQRVSGGRFVQSLPRRCLPDDRRTTALTERLRGGRPEEWNARRAVHSSAGNRPRGGADRQTRGARRRRNRVSRRRPRRRALLLRHQRALQLRRRSHATSSASIHSSASSTTSSRERECLRRAGFLR